MRLFFKSRKRKEAEFMAPQWLKLVKESTDLINNTKTPDVFFFRYEFLIETVNKLIGIEKYIKFKGDTPTKLLEQINIKKVHTINDFIDRFYEDTLKQINKLKTDKAKLKRINEFHPALSSYFCHMESENINKVKELDKSLKNIISDNTDKSILYYKLHKILKMHYEQYAGTAISISTVNTDKPFNYSKWHIMISFGKSTSKSYEKAVYLAKGSPNYDEIIDENGNPTHTATFSSSKKDFLDFIVLYDLVSNWKSTVFIINGEIIDKKTIGKIKYCYGDKCRSVKSNFCYGASYMTANPFGCHRLQISSSNNPWWKYYNQKGSHYELDREAIIERIKLAASTFKYCPEFDIENIMKIAMSLPLLLNKKEYEQLALKESTIYVEY